MADIIGYALMAASGGAGVLVVAILLYLAVFGIGMRR